MPLSCSCDYDYSPSVYRDKWVRAAKAHRCSECGSVIPKGAEHEYVFGIWDGQPEAFRTCSACWSIRVSLTELGFCCLHGTVRDDYREYLADFAPPAINREGQ